MAISLQASAKPIRDSIRTTLEGKWVCDRLPVVTDELQETARSVKRKVEIYLEKTPTDELKKRLVHFLGHFYVDQKSAEAYAAEARDWLLALQDLPYWAIDKGMVEYLTHTTKRGKPLPGLIRERAQRAMGKYNVLLLQCNRILQEDVSKAAPKLSDEEREAAKLRVSEIAKQAKKDLLAGGGNDAQ